MIIDTKAPNVAPVIDPVGAVVCAADISNVRTVLVDGTVVKDDFKLVQRRCPAAPARRGVARLPRRRVRRAGARLAAAEGDCLSLSPLPQLARWAPACRAFSIGGGRTSVATVRSGGGLPGLHARPDQVEKDAHDDDQDQRHDRRRLLEQ